jgi:hypothetical protein
MIRKILMLACLFLVATAPAAAQSEESFMFQTVLILGSATGPSDLTDVPANVTKALDDVKQFLPYKNYRLIDSSLLRSSAEARGRLTAADGGPEFDLSLSFRPTEDDTLFVRSFGIDTLIAQPQNRIVREDGKSRVEHEPPTWVRKNVISASFTVEVGETIVVGSSKLNGSGEAIIVLFTAMR